MVQNVWYKKVTWEKRNKPFKTKDIFWPVFYPVLCNLISHDSENVQGQTLEQVQAVFAYTHHDSGHLRDHAVYLFIITLVCYF